MSPWSEDIHWCFMKFTAVSGGQPEVLFVIWELDTEQRRAFSY